MAKTIYRDGGIFKNLAGVTLGIVRAVLTTDFSIISLTCIIRLGVSNGGSLSSTGPPRAAEASHKKQKGTHKRIVGDPQQKMVTTPPLAQLVYAASMAHSLLCLNGTAPFFQDIGAFDVWTSEVGRNARRSHVRKKNKKKGTIQRREKRREKKDERRKKEEERNKKEERKNGYDTLLAAGRVRRLHGPQYVVPERHSTIIRRHRCFRRFQ